MSSSKKKFGKQYALKQDRRTSSKAQLVCACCGEPLSEQDIVESKSVKSKHVDARAFDLIFLLAERIEKDLQERGISDILSRPDLLFEEFRKLDLNVYEPKTPYQSAQTMMWNAFAETQKYEKIKLAREALKVYPDCADAFVLLAELSAKTTSEKKDRYYQAIEAGRNTFDLVQKSDEQSDDWKTLSKAGYLRALRAMIDLLYDEGDIHLAVEYAKEVMLLDHTDAFVKFKVIPMMVEGNMSYEINWQLGLYPGDRSCPILYSRALALYKLHGECPSADRAIEEAIAANPVAADYLLGKSCPPSKLILDPMKLGSIDEAHAYFHSSERDWQSTSNALNWLKKFSQSRPVESESRMPAWLSWLPSSSRGELKQTFQRSPQVHR